MVLAAVGITYRVRQTPQPVASDGYVGSSSCRACHEKFYQLWSTSHHGLAMQVYSPEFARAAQLVDSPAVRIGDTSYKAEITGKGGWIVEHRTGTGEHRYPIEQALGGKNVYYFLAPLERGHLQVLPLAFDMRTKTWMDATLSMTMDENVPHAQAVTWHDRTLTFNTSCYGCHASQIETNYDPADDSYHTTRAAIGPATQEYVASLASRQDDFAQHLNMGNFRGNRGDLEGAVVEYEKAAVLRPDFAPPLVNAAVAYSQVGDMSKAESALRRAITAEPTEAAAHFKPGIAARRNGEYRRGPETTTRSSATRAVKRRCRIRSGGPRWQQKSCRSVDTLQEGCRTRSREPQISVRRCLLPAACNRRRGRQHVDSVEGPVVRASGGRK